MRVKSKIGKNSRTTRDDSRKNWLESIHFLSRITWGKFTFMRVTQNFMKFFHPLKNTHWFNIGKECFQTFCVIKLWNDVKKCTNPSTPSRWKDYQKQPHLRLFVLRLKKFFTNGRHTTLIQNHALWLGLFVFLITFVIHFHPIFLIKKVPKLNLKLKIYLRSQRHKVKFPFSFWLSCEKYQNNGAEWEAWFTTIYRKYFKGYYVFREMLGSEKAHAYTHKFRCPQPSNIGNGMKKVVIRQIFGKWPIFIFLYFD